MSHTHASELYRRERIRTHRIQLRATLMVRMHLGRRYGLTSLRRHDRGIERALRGVEQEFH